MAGELYCRRRPALTLRPADSGPAAPNICSTSAEDRPCSEASCWMCAAATPDSATSRRIWLISGFSAWSIPLPVGCTTASWYSWSCACCTSHVLRVRGASTGSSVVALAASELFADVLSSRNDPGPIQLYTSMSVSIRALRASTMARSPSASYATPAAPMNAGKDNLATATGAAGIDTFTT